ncbi:MAG: hypothetical protein JW966_01165 [Anaerolineae bacterium]|nr:hypothetical protein [Anaerolineae bacterium]
MENLHRTAVIWILLLAVGVGLAISGCGPVSDVLGERKQPTPTRQPFTTATPGGHLSVWLVAPTGQASGLEGALTPSPSGVTVGNPVGPAATATAVKATIEAATQTAAAPLVMPYYQPDECPETRPMASPPRPADFTEYPIVLGSFLSSGGAPAVVEATLRNWGAITDVGGVVQADTDITGNGVLEVIITLFNPAVYNPDALLNAGQLFVYGCDSGGYRLLYQTAYNPGIALPVLLRVGDMNADVRNELVFFTETCTTSSCYREAKILTWNAVVGAFEELNNGQIVAINGRFGIVDIDADGVLELTADIDESAGSSGPGRVVRDTWDWTGLDYVLAVREQEGARYMIHAVYDADDRLRAGDWGGALEAYDQLRKTSNLQLWGVSGEYEALRAYVAFRIMTVHASRANARAEDWLAVLQSENPEGSAGYPFTQMAVAFMNNYRATGDARAACAEAKATGRTLPDLLRVLNSYGGQNRTYTLDDLCTF